MELISERRKTGLTVSTDYAFCDNHKTHSSGRFRSTFFRRTSEALTKHKTMFVRFQVSPHLLSALFQFPCFTVTTPQWSHTRRTYQAALTTAPWRTLWDWQSPLFQMTGTKSAKCPPHGQIKVKVSDTLSISTCLFNPIFNPVQSRKAHQQSWSHQNKKRSNIYFCPISIKLHFDMIH